MPRKSNRGVTAIKHTQHQQKQKNTPTEQAAPDARSEKPENLQPRACVPNVRAIDRGAPRLSWQRGDNDETHATEAHPLFIREKIIPLETITKLTTLPDPKDDLFHDLNGLPEDAKYDFYQHDINWRNRIIHADSTAAMASLLEFDGLGGQVQTIYFDPPYGINFNANFQADSRKTETSGEVLPHDPTMIKAFRDTYANGIHTYLDTIKRVVTYARELLTESGSIFLQIGNDNMSKLDGVLAEIFGEENRVAIIPFAKSTTATAKHIPQICDYLLWYAKNKTTLKYHQLYQRQLTPQELVRKSHTYIELPDGTIRPPTNAERLDVSTLPSKTRFLELIAPQSPGISTTGRSNPYVLNGTTFPCPKGKQWSVSKEGLDRLAELNRLHVNETSDQFYMKKYYDERPGTTIHNMWEHTRPVDMHYVVETSEKVVERCILMSSDPGDLILDPTCGSGTTAYVAEKHGRRWITTDTSRTAINLARQRVATAIYDSYLLQDSTEGAKAEAERGGPPRTSPFHNNIAHGFVYERVQAVSAASLAYDHPQEPTLLVDQPVKKSGVKRVAGPFTIELSSPHRYLPLSDREDTVHTHTANAVDAVLHALRTGGIYDPQAPNNPIRIDDIEEWAPGRASLSDKNTKPDENTPYITHTGQLRINQPKQPPVHEPCTILITPPDVTVPAHWIDRAIKDTVRAQGYKHLVILAFSYEATDAAYYNRARINVYRTQVNQDLTMGLSDATKDASSDLKNTKGDNSIIMVGEPNVEVRKIKQSGLYEIEVHGTITYDPKTRNVTTAGPQSIEYWAIDTDYDGNAFNVRDMHFPHPTDKQLTRLQKQLGKKLNETRWEQFTGYVSRPFHKPESGQIMVRIITTTGTEMEVVKHID